MSAFDPSDERRGSVRVPSPVLTDFWSQLLFPRILRAGGVAARPERVLAGVLTVLVVGGAAVMLPRSGDGGGVVGRIGSMAALALDGWLGSLVRLDLPDLHERVRLLLLETPRQAFEDGPWSSVLLAAVAMVAWGLGGLSIARGAGMEMGRRVRLRASVAWGYALIKGPAAVLALAMVPAIVAGLLAVPWALGLLLAAPGLDVVGGVVHLIGLVCGIGAALLLLAWLGAWWLAVPAVACDGSDAFDAVQRSLGLFLTRPVSVGLHMLLAGVQGVVLVGLVWLACDLGSTMAAGAAGLASERGALLMGARGVGDGAAVRLISLWHALPALLTAGYAVSYAHCAAVAVYLNARQFVDGQEPNEMWMPGGAGEVIPPDPADSGDEPDGDG
jgi:hypothetical protein